MKYRARCSSYRTYTKCPPTRKDQLRLSERCRTFPSPQSPSGLFAQGCNPGVCLSCTAALAWWADHVPPSASTSQPPKVKATFCKAHLWDTSLFCIQGVCEKNDQLPLLPCPPMLGSSFFLQGLTRSWPTSPTVQLQGPGTHLIPFSPWIPRYKKAQSYKPSSVGSSTFCPPKEKGRGINYQDTTGREPNYSYLSRSEPTGSLLIPLVDHRASLMSK